jgi:hypothetical protein
MVQTERPLTTPREVRRAARRPPRSAFLRTMAMSGPGVRITTTATTRNGTSLTT